MTDEEKAQRFVGRAQFRLPTNKNGDVDLTLGMPSGAAHVRRAAYSGDHMLFIDAGIQCAPAIVAWKNKRRDNHPIYDGVVLYEGDLESARALIAARDEHRKNASK